MVVTGMRRDESAARASLVPWEITDTKIPGRLNDGKPFSTVELSYRPLLDWKLADIVEVHRRNGVAPNPLYMRGFGRVGCFPCIFASKAEIAKIADEVPEIIDEIASLEEELTASAALRIGDERLRTFFQKGNSETDPRSGSIRKVVAWSRTARGGVQPTLGLEDPNDDGGCGVWGLCEHGDEGWEV